MDFKFVVLKILCDHELYIPLNLPIRDKIDSAANVKEQFWYHPLYVSLTDYYL